MVAALSFGSALAVPATANANESPPPSTFTEADCTGLAGLPIPAATIGLPTGGGAVMTAQLIAATATAPVHCQVRGSIAPESGAFAIEFGVAVPMSWNGESFQFGGGGANGSIPNLTGASATVASGESPLARGFATYGSDSGHQGNGVTWVVDDESWMNYAYEQIKKTHDASFLVIEALTGSAPHQNYWSGNSQGGREALEAVTRYPDDYDGVISRVPLSYFGQLTYNSGWQGVRQHELDGYIPPTKATTLANAVKSVCDPLDGATDGVINNYVECNRAVDPSLTPGTFSFLECEGGTDLGDECFSTKQLEALSAFYGPVEYPYPLANGESSFLGWAGGMEDLPALGFGAPWMFSPQAPSFAPNYYGGGGGVLGGAVIQARLSGLTDGSWPMLNLDLAAQREKIQAISAELDVPTDISGWIEGGGKLIMVTTASDAITNPRAQMALYDAWVDRHGQEAVDGSVAYYVVPNTGHAAPPSDASGTQIATNLNLIDSLTSWANDGPAPASALTATAVVAGETVASKPICRYPNYPAYSGSGDLHDAASYSCSAPADTDPTGQQVQVEVPQAAPGEFVWSIDGTSTLIDLGVATEEGDHFAAAGSLNPLRVTDTRSGGPEWSVSASVSSFNAGGKSFGGDYLGWTPSVIDEAGDAQPGPETTSRWFGGEGLAAPSLLAFAEQGHVSGSAVFGADLDLRIPLDVLSGTYQATLTVTALS